MNDDSAFHILRTAAGIRDIDHLAEVQAHFRRQHANFGECVVIATRRVPRKAEHILDYGGAVYWIIGRAIRARQKILDIEESADTDGKSQARLYLDPQIYLTRPYPRKPVQGWRYLADEDAPPDLRPLRAWDHDPQLPAQLERALAEMGLF